MGRVMGLGRTQYRKEKKQASPTIRFLPSKDVCLPWFMLNMVNGCRVREKRKKKAW